MLTTSTHQQFDVLVIGGGPAGMAAAARAAECGVKVGIVDDNAALGGQIWRGSSSTNEQDVRAHKEDEATKAKSEWGQRLATAGVKLLCGMRIFHQPEPGVLLAEGSSDLFELEYEKLIVATGARERFLPFPGWTLPNVMGAGGLQAMVKCGLPIRGKRVVVAGTGPLLVAVAAYLRQHGAQIPLICEQASSASLARFALALLPQPQKLIQGLRLKKQLAGIPFAPSSWPIAALGAETLQAVRISRNGKSETVPCDYLACGFHLVPNIELPSLLGCRIQNGFVQTDDLQCTTVAGVFCAGEPTGIGGIELALVEGQIAGLAAAERTLEAKTLFHEREKLRGFIRVLDQTFRLRSELRALPQPETLVCRCEDVSYSRLVHHTSWRAAKLHTRCGMGPCQGRICGPATQFLLKWNPDSVRPPIFPSRLESLATIASQPEPQHNEILGGH